MRTVQQPAGGQSLHVPARGDGRDTQSLGEIRHPYGAALTHQIQQSVMTFGGTFAHGGSPSGG
ncbi:hypothetical protein GCM10011583_26290 [Streptomyces camponoticapitis]|uniref:Uncharacterized protein n=1 Tax=Streptomyces camponoticapitis TaxID=1616125 RepID=A0ABQ2E788_9ACTN|nr:hypothetical protein GCM10011583_26290 [Streptomyces camponoticapitis]